MRVHDPLRERSEGDRADDAHVAGEDHQVDRGRAQGRGQERVLGGAGGLVTLWQPRARAPSRSPARPPSRGRGRRGRRTTRTTAPPSAPRSAAATSARRFEPGPRDADRDPPPAGVTDRLLRVSAPRRSVGRHDLADAPGGNRLGLQRPQSSSSTASGATTTIIPSPPLKVARSSSSSSPPRAPNRRITDGIGQRAGSSRAASPAGQRPRHVARQSAAGDVGDPTERPSVRLERVAQPEDRRRRTPGSGRGGPRRASPARAPARPPGAHPRPRRRASVGGAPGTARGGRGRTGRPGRGRARSRWRGARTTARPTIASPGPDGRAVDQPVALDDPDAEAGQVELVLVHEPRVLRRLAADERAAGLAGSRPRSPRRARRHRSGRAARPPRSRGRTAAPPRCRRRRRRTSPRGRGRWCRSARAPRRSPSSSPPRPSH